MSFFGYATFHGLVMRMFTGVVVNLERCRCKGFDNLAAPLELVHNPYCFKIIHVTFKRIESSTGVIDIVERRLPNSKTNPRRIDY